MTATPGIGSKESGLQQHVPGLRDFSTATLVLAELAPERMSLSQAVFFLFAGLADLAGRPATFTDLKEAVGSSINKSLHTTYKVLLDESRRRGTSRDPGLGWLTREVDREDNRKKYLRLTNRGRQVLKELGIAIDQRTGGEA